MITLLSGGTGTPKLIQGLLQVVDESELAVIVNTAEDHWLSHGYFSPDVDTVVYTVAGLIDDTTWHGIRGDTYQTHEALKGLGSSEFIRIGDRDRAVHIWRGERMKTGESLSRVTKQLCERLGVEAAVIPMSNDGVETVIETDRGLMDLHEFWVKKKGCPEVEGVFFRGMKKARTCGEAVDAIADSDRVIIGPSNPVTSIHPIISLEGIKKALERDTEKVVAVSPIVGQSAFSGPAEKLMKTFGIEVSIRGVADFYKDLISGLVVDSSEGALNLGGMKILKTDIIMDTLAKRKALAEFVLGVEL